MREIIDHIVAGDAANHKLTLHAMDEPGSGGANHRYEIRGYQVATNPSAYSQERTDVCDVILFQNGPIKESGVNGVTGEALLAILIDRLRGFQSGPYACRENQNQLDHLEKALYWAQNRTRQRIARGVEGTHEK